MAKEIATKTKLDTRIAADIAAAMPVANQPAAAKAVAAEVAKKAIVIDTEEVQAAVEQAVEGSADVIVAQAAGAATSGAAAGGAAAGISTTALVVAGVAVAAAASSSSSSSTPAAATPAATSAPAATPAPAAVNPISLTSGTDAPALTAGNDVITGSINGQLATADIIIDRSNTDADVLNAVANVATVAARIQGIETINITGEYSTTGLDLAATSGTKVLNLNTGVPGGSATVTNASTLNAEKIAAGANITTLAVTATASGTRDTVVVDGNKATSVTLTGGAGTDSFEVSVGTGASVKLATASSNIDTYKINASGKLTLDGDAAAKTVTLNATDADLTVTLTNGQTIVGTGSTSKWDVTGSKNVTLVVADDADGAKIKDITAIGLTNSGSGKVNIQIKDTSSTNESNLSTLKANSIEFAATGTGDIKASVNENTGVVFTGNATGGGAVTINMDDGVTTNTAWTAGEGTLRATISESLATSALATTSAVGTLILEAKADSATDTKYGAVLTIAELDTKTSTKTETVVINGSENLTITKWAADATASTLTAANMTGKLTISEITEASTLNLGSGNDSITSGANNKAFTIYANSGDDTVDLGSVTSAANTVYGGDGNDKITGGGGADSVVAGAGDDTIIVSKGGVDTVTLGDGKDVVEITSDKAVATTNTLKITDFVLGTDKLILVGASAGDVKLTAVTPATEVYTIDSKFVATLSGNTGTNLASSVQLGKLGSNFTAANGKTVTAGDFGDYIAAAGGGDSITVTTGTGNDVIYVAEGAGVTTVKDFTFGTDKIVLSGTSTSTANIDLSAAATPTSGAYTIGAGTQFKFTLTDSTVTDLKGVVQLGDSKNVFTMTADKNAVGGDGNDNIKTGTATGDTVVVTGGKGADLIEVTTATKIETIKFALGDSVLTGYDKITGYTMSATVSDVLDLVSTNVATGLGQVASGSITSATVTNGFVSFNGGIEINNTNLTDALNFLANNVVGTDTVAFVYKNDINGDGDTSDTISGVAEYAATFVFQSGTTDTVVELKGVSTATAISSTTQSTTTIYIA